MVGSRLKFHDIPDLFKVPRPESNDINRDHHHDEKINGARSPLRHRVEFARAFFLKILMEPAQGFVELATHFTSRVLMRKDVGKFPGDRGEVLEGGS